MCITHINLRRISLNQNKNYESQPNIFVIDDIDRMELKLLKLFWLLVCYNHYQIWIVVTICYHKVNAIYISGYDTVK